MIYFRAYTVYPGATTEEQEYIREHTMTEYATFELRLDMVMPEFVSYELVPTNFNGNEIEPYIVPLTDTIISQN